MPDYEDQKAKPKFGDHWYYGSTDLVEIYAEVDNDAWIGTGDAMATFEILREDRNDDQIYARQRSERACDAWRDRDVLDRERDTASSR
jgi:hypothetical protein